MQLIVCVSACMYMCVVKGTHACLALFSHSYTDPLVTGDTSRRAACHVRGSSDSSRYIYMNS